MAQARKITFLMLAWAAGAVYVYAGIIKFFQPAVFLQDILGYHLVSYEIAYIAAFLLPGIEIVAGGAMFSRYARVEASWILLALTLVFICALISAWVRGLDVSCGCFGHSEMKTDFSLLIARDVAIALGCASGFLFENERLPKASLLK